MTRTERLLHAFAIALASFLALSAVPGGLALMAGIGTPPIEQLRGSVFGGWMIPGLALLVLVGGSAALAAVLLLRRSRFAASTAAGAGAIVMTFEFVEVLAIGSPPGPARVMQILYFSVGLGLVSAALALLLWHEARLAFGRTARDR